MCERTVRTTYWIKKQKQRKVIKQQKLEKSPTNDENPTEWKWDGKNNASW